MIISQKIRPRTTTPTQWRSAEWVAHNAAMAEKRELLGHGKRPVIGSAYRPRIVVTPAIEVCGPRRHAFPWEQLACSVLWFVGTLGGLLLLGHLWG